jgi:serine protease AprX
MNMNKLFFFFFLIVFRPAFSQTTNTSYWIIFKDKKNTPYSINNPRAFLSERSIARRERQHIPTTVKDLPVDPFYLTQLIKSGASVKASSKWFNAALINLADEEKLNAISKFSFIKSIRKIESAKNINSKSKFEEEIISPVEAQRGLSEFKNVSSLNYGPSYNQAHMIGADCMHDKGYQGEGMVIAQFDSGFLDVNTIDVFDSLRMNDQILGCRDFVTGDTMVFEDHYHGMDVLSCMGGNLPGKLIGTAPKASYWLLRTEDANSETLQEEINWTVAAEFADSVGADIINSSLGYTTFDGGIGNHTYADMDGNTTIITKAADWAASTGIFVCNSAGNSGNNSWFRIVAPADADSVLTVGAVDPNGAVAYFSSRGPSYDGRVKPNIATQGYPVTLAAIGGGIGSGNGTSFSSPIAAGAVACLWQANPAKNNMEILHAIEQSSNRFSTADSLSGYGIPDFCLANRILSGILIREEESFSIYPNPFNSSFQVAFYSPVKQTVLIELFDISGKQIYSQLKTFDVYSDNRFILSGADNIAVGVYLLTLKTDLKIYHEKIVKQ